MTDDRHLADAYEELVAARAPSTRAACPPPEALLALVERQGGEDARLATLDRVMSCVPCRRDLDLLRAASAATVAAETAPATSGETPLPVTRSASRRVSWAPLVAAAGTVIVVGVGVIARRPGDAPTVPRGGRNALVLAAPEHVTGGSVVLRWHRVVDAPRYRVEVFAPSGASVAEGIVVDTSYVVSAAALGGHPDSMRWSVTALRPDGELRSTMGRLVP